MDEWLTTGTVARLKGVTKTAVQRAIKERRLAGRRIGPWWYVKEGDAAAWEPKAGWPKGRPRKQPQE